MTSGMDFFNIIDDHMRMYEEFMLPVIICDTGFIAHWLNPVAKQLYPELAGERGVADLLREFDTEKLLSQIENGGAIRVDGVLAFSGIHLNLMPLLRESELCGVVIMMVSPEAHISPNDRYLSSQTTVSFEDVVRNSVEEIFRSMDTVSSKASMFESGWIKSGLHSIAQNSYRIMRVATNISTYARFQSESPALVFQSVDVFDLIRNAENVISGLAAEMGVPLTIELPDRESIAGVDVKKFQFALLNVLHNSLYFTQAGNRIEIKGTVDDRKVEVIVSDCGMGIDPQNMGKIFTPYVSIGHDGRAAGIGLGLTLVKMIMDAHSGEIEVSSTPGKGTEVTLTIPRSIFSRRLSLKQPEQGYDAADSFSYYYIGLSDAASSPYREDDDG